MKLSTTIMTPLILILAVGAGCEYYKEGQDGITSREQRTSEFTRSESDRTRELEAQINDLRNQLDSQPDPNADLLKQLDDLQRQLDEVRAVETPEDSLAEDGSTEVGSASTEDTTPSPGVMEEPVIRRPFFGAALLPTRLRPPDTSSDDTPSDTSPEATPSPEECVPPSYSDDRTAVPLVITAYRDINFGGKKARFVKNTDKVAMSYRNWPGRSTGGISSLKIQRGPNYVEGDKVIVYKKALRLGEAPVPIHKLGPGSYNDLEELREDLDRDGRGDSRGEGLNEKIVSLTIERLADATTKPCADGPGDDVDLAWNDPIHLIADIHLTNEVDESEQVIKDIAISSGWGRGTRDGDIGGTYNVADLSLSKGPHFQEGNNVVLYEREAAGGLSTSPLSMTDHSLSGGPLGIYHFPYRTDETPLGLMQIGSIYFRDASGSNIFDAADAE